MSAPPNRAINNETDVARNSPKVKMSLDFYLIWSKATAFSGSTIDRVGVYPFGQGQGFDPKNAFNWLIDPFIIHQILSRSSLMDINVVQGLNNYTVQLIHDVEGDALSGQR